METGIVLVRPPDVSDSKQRLPYYVGISEATAGATGISMNLVIIPPGGSAEPHYHRDFETAIYLIKACPESAEGAVYRHASAPI